MEHKPEHRKEDLAYYLTLFKLKGHETWRMHLAGFPDGFMKSREHEQRNGVKIPDVTEMQVLRFDRINGTFSQKK